MRPANEAIDLMVQWAYGYPSLETITAIRNELTQIEIRPEVRDQIDQLFVWLAAGAFLPVAGIVLSGIKDEVNESEPIDVTAQN